MQHLVVSCITTSNNNVRITSSTFHNNSASYYGGGIYVQGGSSIIYRNNTSMNNIANISGGVIVLLGVRVANITSCRFIFNTAHTTAGAIGGLSAQVFISDSIYI